jgi:hypothetical protein
MHAEFVNTVQMPFWTIRLTAGKNKEYVTDVLEYFPTEKEAHDYLKREFVLESRIKNYQVRQELLWVNVQRTSKPSYR